MTNRCKPNGNIQTIMGTIIMKMNDEKTNLNLNPTQNI